MIAVLDKRSKVLLEFLDKLPDKQFLYYVEAEYPDAIGSPSDLYALARHLEATGYVETIRSRDGRTVGIRLSHVGRNRREFSRISFWSYVGQHWIAFLALIIATASLAWQIVNAAIDIFGRSAP